MIGKKLKFDLARMKSYSYDAYKALMGHIELDNKTAIKNVLNEYCLYLESSELFLTSGEIYEIIEKYSGIKICNMDKRFIMSEITRRISGNESHLLSGYFSVLMDEDKPVKRKGSYVRKYVPDASDFIEKNVLDI
ncbi:MAG: hypothetical protein [Caudoviricetes sp.]|nr:MAG: hypothetical protein [Caudoviricetes sp.]